MPLSCPVTFVSMICDQIIRKTGNNASLGSFMPHSEKKAATFHNGAVSKIKILTNKKNKICNFKN